jgi:glycerol-3-phosphate cytidylyltransferase|tara:strand:- start:170 stop:520 length:351 start_codon:yes stop_codon:yes gene_type:complete
MFEECKQYCDYLIVGVQSDPSIDRPEKNSPIQSHEERLGLISSIKFVDEVKSYSTESSLVDMLKEINPDVRILGADHRGKEFTGHNLDIKCIFNSRDHGYSTSELRRRVYEAEKKK